VKGLPLVAVAVLAAMVSTAVALRLRSRAGAGAASRAGATAPMGSASASVPPVTSGLGAGPPPAVEGSRAARTLHGGARHTHRAAGHVPLELPPVAWTRDMGGPVESQVVTSPDEQTLYVASLGGSLTAIARADGAVKWTYALGDRAYGTPSVADDGTIYAGSDAKKVVALSPEGKARWTLDVDDEADTGSAIAPDGTLVLAAGHRVYGISPQGWVVFRFAARRKVFTAPAVDGHGRVFFGSQDHHAYGLAPRGGLLWSTDLGADVDGAPVVGDDGAVTFGSDGDEIVHLEAESGRVLWRAKVGGFVRGTLALARNGDILAGVYGPAPRAVRVRASDGILTGDFPVPGTGAREFGVHGGALEDDAGTLVFGAQDDTVVAIDASGRLRWRFTTGGDVDAPVTLLTGGALVVGSDDGKVVLLAAM
jgi:outer membrane protein assembly factor BamB